MRRALRFAPWLLPGFLTGCLFARCVILSAKHLLWADELFTWYPATASFGTMLASTRDTINSAPPLYFIVAWAWARVFGDAALSLRLLSTFALSAAIFVMFAVLRRAYGVFAAAIAVGLALTFSHSDLLYQSSSARFHTLLIAEVALGIWIYQRMMQRPPSTRLLVANAATHAAMVMTHYFGPLYSAAILSGVLLTGRIRHRNPIPMAVSIVAGWLVFIPWIPVFQRHQQMGRPSFWMPVPDLAVLEDHYARFVGNDFGLLLKWLGASVLIGLALAVLSGRGLRRALGWLSSVRNREIPLLALLPAFGAIPLLIYFLSTRPGKFSLFGPFYMLSGALGWAIICAHLSHRALRLGALMTRRRARRALVAGQALIVVGLLAWGGWVMVRHARNAVTDPPWVDVPRDPGDELVVVEHIHWFMGMNFYSRHPERYVFLVDPEVGVAEGGGGPLNHQIMAALKRQFPAHFAGVRTTDEFLASNPSFWVDRADMKWWPMRIASNPNFVVDTAMTQWSTFHVHRKKR